MFFAFAKSLGGKISGSQEPLEGVGRPRIAFGSTFNPKTTLAKWFLILGMPDRCTATVRLFRPTLDKSPTTGAGGPHARPTPGLPWAGRVLALSHAKTVLLQPRAQVGFPFPPNELTVHMRGIAPYPKFRVPGQSLLLGHDRSNRTASRRPQSGPRFLPGLKPLGHNLRGPGSPGHGHGF